MPGSGYTLRCPGCERASEVLAGGSYCERCGELWMYEQRGCNACGAIVSVAAPPHCDEQDNRCPACAGVLALWAGRVWFEGDVEERLVGPCPACDAVIDARQHALSVLMWD